MHVMHAANSIRKSLVELEKKMSKAHDPTTMADAFLIFAENMSDLVVRIEKEENSRNT